MECCVDVVKLFTHIPIAIKKKVLNKRIKESPWRNRKTVECSYRLNVLSNIRLAIL